MWYYYIYETVTNSYRPMISLPLLAAFVAFVSWGFGDFFIQRSARRIGSLPALFYITGLSSIVLLPVVWPYLTSLTTNSTTLGLLGLTLLITFFVAVMEFEAFRRGKLSVVEPVMSFELVITLLISVVILGEHLSWLQVVLVIVLFAGILLTVIQRQAQHRWLWWRRKSKIEQGVILAVASATVMAVTNILTGLSSRAAGPLLAIWFIHAGLASMVFIWLSFRQRLDVLRVPRRQWGIIIGETFFDTLAWLSYGLAVISLPIGITIAITESYIALAAILGLVLNHERLQRHQLWGTAVALCAAISLALTLRY